MSAIIFILRIWQNKLKIKKEKKLEKLNIGYCKADSFNKCIKANIAEWITNYLTVSISCIA